MKNKKLVRRLVDLGYYTMLRDSNPLDTEEDMVLTDLNKHRRKIADNDISDEDLILMMQAEQTSYLKSIKNMFTFFVVLTIIGICIMFCFGVQLLNTLSYPY